MFLYGPTNIGHLPRKVQLTGTNKSLSASGLAIDTRVNPFSGAVVGCFSAITAVLHVCSGCYASDAVVNLHY